MMYSLALHKRLPPLLYDYRAVDRALRAAYDELAETVRREKRFGRVGFVWDNDAIRVSQQRQMVRTLLQRQADEGYIRIGPMAEDMHRPVFVPTMAQAEATQAIIALWDSGYSLLKPVAKVFAHCLVRQTAEVVGAGRRLPTRPITTLVDDSD